MTSSPIKLNVGKQTDIVIGVNKVDTTDTFETSLSSHQRNCLLESEAPELEGEFREKR